MSALLEARHLSKVFGGGLFDKRLTVALDHFSLAIESSPPQITAIVGESGSGKTTVARLLLGLTTPTTGEVRYEGTNIRALRGDDRRAFLRDVQMIFQDPYEVYNPFYRVEHVLEAPIARFKLANSAQARHALIEESLRAVGLRPEETLGRYPHQLSGGQRQRIMVARAVLIRPRLIIADEPVSMVDASLRATILDSLRELNRQYGMSIVYITHDLTTAYQISNNIIVLYRGAVSEAGDVDLVVGQPRHPYTQLLIDSVPEPDPEHHWGGGGTRANGASHTPSPAATNGRVAQQHHLSSCPFADRCPQVMSICQENMPPLYRLDPTRAAACFLYRDTLSVLAADQLNEVITSAHA
jgi:oligopeptide/dipeptide ABC transporter ATP-binding protein